MSVPGQTKRRPTVPCVALLGAVSKAELLEVAWHLASLTNAAGSSDDDESTHARLVEEIDTLRVQRGARKLTGRARVFLPGDTARRPAQGEDES